MNRELVTYGGRTYSYTITDRPDKTGCYSSVLRWEDSKEITGRYITKRIQKKKSVHELREFITTKAVIAFHAEIEKLPSSKPGRGDGEAGVSDSEFKPSDALPSGASILMIEDFLHREYDTMAGKAVYNWAPSTKASYRRMIKKVLPYLPRKPFILLTKDDYYRAIDAHVAAYAHDKAEKKKRKPKSVSKEYDSSTISQFSTIFSNILSYAVHLGLIPENLLKNNRPGGDGEISDERKGAKSAIAEIAKRRQYKFSLTPEENVKLWAEIKKWGWWLNSDGSVRMLAAIMDATGLRTGECCGLRFGDFVQIDSGREAYAFIVSKQFSSTENRLTDILKTTNAYRQIPVHRDLANLIVLKRNVIRQLPGISEDKVDRMPLVNKPEKHFEHWNPNYVNDDFKKLMCTICEPTRAEMLIDAFQYDEMEGKDALSDATSYILRKNFCTYSYAVCGMTPQEVRYLLGHAVDSGNQKANKQIRRVFSERDAQIRLWEKINLRPLSGCESKKDEISFNLRAVIGEVQGTSFYLDFPKFSEARKAMITVKGNEPEVFEKIAADMSGSYEDYIELRSNLPIDSDAPPDFSVRYRQVYKEIKENL